MTDLLLVNGNVLTMDPARPRATAVAVDGGRISGVLDGPAGAAAHRVVDLGGATLLPGFHDAHNHMAWFGLTLAEVDLRSPGIGSLDQLYAAVARGGIVMDVGTGGASAASYSAPGGSLPASAGIEKEIHLWG